MNKLLILIFCLIGMLLFGFFSCNEQVTIQPIEDEFLAVNIPESYRPSLTNRSNTDDIDETILNVTFTNENGTEVTGKVHVIMHGDESVEYFAMRSNVFEELDLDQNFWIDQEQSDPNSRINKILGCFGDCRDIPKGEGRGTCKAECWLNIALAVAAIVVAAV